MRSSEPGPPVGLTGVARSVVSLIDAGAGPSSAVIDDATAPAAGVLGSVGLAQLRRRLGAELLGTGPLDSILADPAVTDVLVNGDGSVWVDRADRLTRAGVLPGGAGGVRALAVRLAGIAGRRLDEAAPYVDALLPGGTRLHAILPPLVEGAHISLRVPHRDHPRLEALESFGMFPSVLGRVIRGVVEARTAFVISGGTGAGKTTLLCAMLAHATPGERMVVVEDTSEVQVPGAHVVRLQARPPNLEGAGEVTLTTLVRQALRMRPDRLVVGEVRGAEVRELLNALNTGHEGGCGTIHANSSQDVVARFEALGMLAGLDQATVRVQLASAVSVAIHVRRGADGARSVDSIGVLHRHGTEVQVVQALDARGTPGPGWRALRDLCRLPAECLR